MSALNLFGLWALVAGDDLEYDLFPFVQRFESVAQNCRVMHKNILPGILSDKSKTLRIIPPFYFATRHISSPDFPVQGGGPSAGETHVAKTRFPKCSGVRVRLRFVHKNRSIAEFGQVFF